MKKFQESYRAHDSGYIREPDYYDPNKILERTKNDFRNSGYELAINITKSLPKIHIDIGSGVGWLVNKTSGYFEKCYAIEPSQKAVEYSSKLNHDIKNITHINKNMIDGYLDIEINQPVFLTTGAVFSHIQDEYIENFLAKLNNAPNGSILFFSENYDKNYNQKLWHIRSRYWWRKNLSGWFLLFFDLNTAGYPSGIYGIKTEHPLNYKPGVLWNFFWQADKLLNFSKSLVKKIFKFSIEKNKN